MAHTVTFTPLEIMQIQKTIFADAIHEAMEWAMNSEADSIKFAHFAYGLDAMMLQTSAYITQMSVGARQEAVQEVEQENPEPPVTEPEKAPAKKSARKKKEETEDGQKDVSVLRE